MNRHLGTIARVFALLALVSTLVVLATGCTPTEPPTVTLSLIPSQITIGGTTTASVTVRSGGQPVVGVNALFAVDPTAVATLGSTTALTNTAGVAQVTLTGVSVGTATVNAVCQGEASDSVTLTVTGLVD
jgi:hypothetical protein